MTVIEALQQANEAAEIPNLSFANIQEFQTFMDSFEYDDYPVNVVVPFTSNGVHNERGIRKSTIPLQGWVLRRIPQDGNDYRSQAIEADYLNPMRILAIKFLKNLLRTEIIDRDGNPEPRDTIRPEYAFLNAHLFGVSYSIQLPIVENACISDSEFPPLGVIGTRLKVTVIDVDPTRKNILIRPESSVPHVGIIFQGKGDGPINIAATGDADLTLQGKVVQLLPTDRALTTRPIRHANYTVATLPAANVNIGASIFVNDESGGPTLAFSDGTNWRRVRDNQIVS